VLRKTTLIGTLTALALMILTVSLCPATAVSAHAGQGLQRYRIVKHARSYDVVRGHHRTLIVRDHERYVKVYGVRRYRVVKRGSRFVLLRQVSSLDTTAPDATPTPNPTPIPSLTQTPSVSGTPDATPTPNPTPIPSLTQTPSGGGTLGVMTPAYMNALRSNVLAGVEPWASSWAWFRPNHVAPAMATHPNVYVGPATTSATLDTMLARMTEDGEEMRCVAIGYAATGNTNYATKAREYLMAWATDNHPTTVRDHADIYSLMWQGRCFFTFAYAYDLTKDSGVYNSDDKSTMRAYFQTATNALAELANWYYGSEWVFTHPAARGPYAWVPNVKGLTFREYDRYVGGDVIGEGTVGMLACAIEAGDSATVAHLLDPSYVFSVQSQIHHACKPDNDGDGAPGGSNPVPQACIFKPGAGDNGANGGPIDYFTYNSKNHVIMAIMARAQGVDMSTSIAELSVTYDYIARFYAPGAEASPAPNDSVNYEAGLPRMVLAYSLFPHNTRLKTIVQAGTAGIDYKGCCVEPEFLGPTTLTLWPLGP
jgi:hypothetical protein